MSEFQKIISDFSPDDEQKNAILVGARQKAASRQKLPQKRVLAVAVLCCTLIAACGVKMWIDSEAYKQKVSDMFDNISFAQTYDNYKFDHNELHVELIGSTCGSDTVTLFYTITSKHKIETEFFDFDFEFQIDESDVPGYKHPAHNSGIVVEYSKDHRTVLYRTTYFARKPLDTETVLCHLYHGDTLISDNIYVQTPSIPALIAKNAIDGGYYTGSVLLDTACLQVQLDFTKPTDKNMSIYDAMNYGKIEGTLYMHSLEAQLIRQDDTVVKPPSHCMNNGSQSQYEAVVYIMFDQMIDINDYKGVIINGQEIYF